MSKTTETVIESSPLSIREKFLSWLRTKTTDNKVQREGIGLSEIQRKIARKFNIKLDNTRQLH